ncbi:DUF349 domain-containing protein [Nakamurella antarctica]|uniref:DUF349 domain-containing protein n=2 Tax=Nakamurella antarctica TaxID=1902245 RepID=A0A3G8ZPZ5_9ACTN|nr:DUF349 domain-containing protein [Nakamurella antarctica]
MPAADQPGEESVEHALAAEAAAETQPIPEKESEPAETAPATADAVRAAATPSAGRPNPGPRPSPIPRPSAGRGPHKSAVPVAPVEPLIETSDPTLWGRVDEAGTVFVRTATGEREVGSWQAGEPEAGLTHYGRRYDDFVTEISLLEKRLATKSGDPKATRTQAQQLRETVDTLAAVGDLDSAAARLETVIAAAETAVTHAAADRASAKAAAVATKEALCVEAEELAESAQWKSTGDRLKTIVDEWRAIRGIDRKTDDVLWKRFARARDTFTRRRGSHFAEMDKERGAAKDSKELLIVKAEALSDSTEWGETAGAYRELMVQWKASGRAPREIEDALWDRFRAAQEKFFARRLQTFAERDSEFEANAVVKEALLLDAEKIDPAADLDAAKAALRSIQDRWEAAGKVPRERIRDLDSRLRAVEEKVKGAEESMWRKTDPETTARLAQFRTRYETFAAQAAKATAAGDTRRAKEASAQAAQWLEWLQAAEGAVE